MWRSAHDKCVLQQCVKVNDELFISATNVSCPPVETQLCPLGTELRCDMQDCCPWCHCGKHTYAINNNKNNNTNDFSSLFYLQSTSYFAVLTFDH